MDKRSWLLSRVFLGENCPPGSITVFLPSACSWVRDLSHGRNEASFHISTAENNVFFSSYVSQVFSPVLTCISWCFCTKTLTPPCIYQPKVLWTVMEQAGGTFLRQSHLLSGGMSDWLHCPKGSGSSPIMDSDSVGNLTTLQLFCLFQKPTMAWSSWTQNLLSENSI